MTGNASLPVYHIAVRADWDRRDKHYEPASFADDGFIHCSAAKQLPEVAAALFRGRSDLVLLQIDPSALDQPLVWEDLYGSGDEFPHLYGALPVSAVTSVQGVSVDLRGSLSGWRPA